MVEPMFEEETDIAERGERKSMYQNRKYKENINLVLKWMRRRKYFELIPRHVDKEKKTASTRDVTTTKR